MRSGALLCVVFALPIGCSEGSSSTPVSSGTTVQVGCYSAAYAGVSYGMLGCGVQSSFGHPVIDAQAVQEYQIQTAFWTGFQPQVYPFLECSSPNALSLPAGIILFGVQLTRQVVMSTNSTLPLAGILAHEWAHQVQFRFNWFDPQAPTVRDSELEADAFSGFYMYLAKGWAGPQMHTYFDTLFSLGYYNFHDKGHHGTPNMRIAAGALGMAVGQMAAKSNRRYTYVELHDEFRRAIAEIVRCNGFCRDPLGQLKLPPSFGPAEAAFIEDAVKGVLPSAPSSYPIPQPRPDLCPLER